MPLKHFLKLKNAANSSSGTETQFIVLSHEKQEWQGNLKHDSHGQRGNMTIWYNSIKCSNCENKIKCSYLWYITGYSWHFYMHSCFASTQCYTSLKKIMTLSWTISHHLRLKRRIWLKWLRVSSRFLYSSSGLQGRQLTCSTVSSYAVLAHSIK